MATTDKDILLAIQRNADKGFRLLMKKYGEPVYWHIRRLVVAHDDAQDASQETFVRIYRSLPLLKADGALSSWIYRIATNEALRMLSHDNGPRQLSLDHPDSRQADTAVADSYVDYGDLEAVKLQNAILSLPTKQQIVFNLRYYDELDYDEIAKIANSTPDSAKASYHVAKQKIIQYMDSQD